MSERRVAQIVGESDRLGQILVQAQDSGQRPGNLSDLQGMSEPGSIVVALVLHKHLSFVLQPTECRGMYDSVSVALKAGPGSALHLGMEPPAAVARFRCVRRKPFGRNENWAEQPPCRSYDLCQAFDPQRPGITYAVNIVSEMAWLLIPPHP